MQVKVDPHQNVSPTRSLHYAADSKVSGASQSLDGGCPLLLSLAANLAGHLTLHADVGQTPDLIVPLSFALAEKLINEYNKLAAAGGGSHAS